MTRRGSGSQRFPYVPGTEWNLTHPVARQPAGKLSSESSKTVPDGSEEFPGTALKRRFPVPLRTGEPMFRASSGTLRGNALIGNCEGRDVLQLRAELLPLLPLHVTLSCFSEFTARALYVTTVKAVWQALKRRKAVVFGVEEWHTLVSSFRGDRANPCVFATWCETKANWPNWKVTLALALGGVSQSELADADTSVGAVLDGWGLQLAGVNYGAELPA